MTKSQLTINPAKKEIVETKTIVIQQAEPETYTVTMTKRQLMFLHEINGNLPDNEESMGYVFYQQVNEIDADFKAIGDWNEDTMDAVKAMHKAYLERLKSLGLDR